MNLELMIPVGFGIILLATWIRVILGAREHPSDTQAPLKSTCIICTGRDSDVVSVYFSRHGWNSRTYNFHMDCVVDAVCNPKKYEGYRVDYAIHIVDAMALKRKLDKEGEIKRIQQALQRRANCKKACEKIKDGNLFSS